MINSSTVLAALAPPSPTAGTTWPRLPRRGVKRPRGLWKARRRLDSASSLTQHQMLQTAGGGCSKSCSSGRGSDTDRDVDESGGEMDDDDISQDSSSSKRQRRDSGRGSVSGTSSSKHTKAHSGRKRRGSALLADKHNANVSSSLQKREGGEQEVERPLRDSRAQAQEQEAMDLMVAMRKSENDSVSRQDSHRGDNFTTESGSAERGNKIKAAPKESNSSVKAEASPDRIKKHKQK